MDHAKIENFKLKDGTYIRYKTIGNGPPLLLLHTFRNRLEYSDLLVQELMNDYSIYTLDLPGFGDSPINTKTNYDQEYVTMALTEFITKLDLSDVTIAGESIGGILPTTVSLKIPNRIKNYFALILTIMILNLQRVYAVVTFLQILSFFMLDPIIGSFFSMLENKFILKISLQADS